MDMGRFTRGSYVFILVVLVLTGWLHLATLLLTVLFSYFALDKLNFARRKWLAVALFLVAVAGIGCGFWYFIKEAIVALPKIANTAIPMIIDYAQKHGVELPFTDLDSLKTVALSSMKDEFRAVGNVARVAGKELAFVLIGVVAAISLFLNGRFELGHSGPVGKNNLYSIFGEAVAARFRSLFQSFEMVMGAQLKISAINTILTTVFVFAAGLPNPGVLIVVTFLCGLLPIIGNITSNTIIVGVAFTLSPKTALAALIFLVAIHKLEYFLNSKIIGDRIKNPVWLTLLALILGERLMGVPGMVLAPVVLHFIKVEASKYRVTPSRTEAPAELMQAREE